MEEKEIDLIEFLKLINGLDVCDYQYYHQLLTRRTVIFNQDVDETIVEAIYLPLKEFEEDDSQEPVTLILNSSGGSVSDGFFLANYLTTYSKPLTIIVTGYATSMATVILAAGGNNPNITRKCYPSTYFLIHDGFIALNPAETKTAQDIMLFNDSVDEDIRNFFITNTNITQEEYDKHTRHQWFIKSEEAKRLNLVDEIV